MCVTDGADPRSGELRFGVLCCSLAPGTCGSQGCCTAYAASYSHTPCAPLMASIFAAGSCCMECLAVRSHPRRRLLMAAGVAAKVAARCSLLCICTCDGRRRWHQSWPLRAAAWSALLLTHNMESADDGGSGCVRRFAVRWHPQQKPLTTAGVAAEDCCTASAAVHQVRPSCHKSLAGKGCHTTLGVTGRPSRPRLSLYNEKAR